MNYAIEHEDKAYGAAGRIDGLPTNDVEARNRETERKELEW